ncbi:unnamed protein product, partial [Sphacelaria rigidula]
ALLLREKFSLCLWRRSHRTVKEGVAEQPAFEHTFRLPRCCLRTHGRHGAIAPAETVLLSGGEVLPRWTTVGEAGRYAGSTARCTHLNHLRHKVENLLDSSSHALSHRVTAADSG